MVLASVIFLQCFKYLGVIPAAIFILLMGHGRNVCKAITADV